MKTRERLSAESSAIAQGTGMTRRGRKNFIIICFFLFASCELKAQKQFYLGLKAGAGFAFMENWINGKHEKRYDTQKLKYNFTGGLELNIVLSKKISLESEIIFLDKGNRNVCDSNDRILISINNIRTSILSRNLILNGFKVHYELHNLGRLNFEFNIYIYENSMEKNKKIIKENNNNNKNNANDTNNSKYIKNKTKEKKIEIYKASLVPLNLNLNLILNLNYHEFSILRYYSDKTEEKIIIDSGNPLAISY